jgi:hypothetical protein
MELMQRYVDRDLNEEETSRLLEHVGQCPECAAMFQRLVRLSRGLEQLPRVAPPYSLVDAILPQLDKIQPEPAAAPASAPSETAETAGRIPKSRRTGRRNHRWWIPRISGVAAVGIVVSLLILNRPEADPLAGNQAAMPEAAVSSQAMMENSSADMQLFVTPTGASETDPAAALQPDTRPEGNMEGASGGSQQPKGSHFRKEQPMAGEIQPRDQYGISQFEKPQTTPPVPALQQPPAEEVREKGPLSEVPPAEDPPAELPPGETPSGEELFGEGSSMSIMDFMPVPEEAVSPDGQWRAVIVEGALQLYRMSDDALVYEQAPDPCMRSGLVWSEDSSFVQYICTDADGNEVPLELRIEDTAFTEYKR